MIPFAHACRAAGHDVLFAAAASVPRPREARRLPFAPLDEPDEARGRRLGAACRPRAGEQDRIVIEEVFAGEFAALGAARTARADRRWRPDVILRETFSSRPAGRRRHRRPDVHVACFLARTGDELDPSARWGACGPAGSRDARRDDPYLTLAPRSLENPGLAGPLGTLRFRAPRPRARRCRTGGAARRDPLVYVSFGSAAAGNGFFPDVYREAADALADAPVRVLLTLGTEVDPAELGPVPGNVHVEPWVPQGAVMAHADGDGRPRRLGLHARRDGRRPAARGRPAVRRPARERPPRRRHSAPACASTGSAGLPTLSARCSTSRPTRGPRARGGRDRRASAGDAVVRDIARGGPRRAL